MPTTTRPACTQTRNAGPPMRRLTMRPKGIARSTAGSAARYWCVTAGVQSSNITVTVICTQTAGTTAMSGIYSKRGSICGGTGGCAQTVRVTAQVPYWPILASFGFRGWGMQLNASSQAAVTGI